MNSSSKLIALSAGGNDQELAEHGLGIEHVNEFMARMSRKLLQDGHRLGFGGTLGGTNPNLTQLLIDAALGWLNEESAQQTDITDHSTWPLINYGSWPYHTSISPEYKAELVGVCHFNSVDPPDVDDTKLVPLLDDWETKDARYYTANALSRMRKESTESTDLRVVFGGRIVGAKGWMAGIAEEVLCSIEADKPTLILGGFGGCARVLADFLDTPGADWPQIITLEKVCEDPKYQEIIVDDYHRQGLSQRYEALKQGLTEFKMRLETGSALWNWGISVETFQKILRETSPRRAIRLVQEGINEIVR